MIERFPKWVYGLDIQPEAKEAIAEIRELLGSVPNLSYVVYFNHVSYNDPILGAHVASLIDPRRTRHLIAPASYSHIDPERRPNPWFAELIREAERCGVEIVPVIQAYQVNNPDFGYTDADARETYKHWIKRLMELGKSGVVTGVLISPEGHRSDDGSLGRGEAGILITGRYLSPTIYIPVGINYLEDFKRGGVNFGKKIRLSVGSIYLQEDPKAPPSVDLLMGNLAHALPEELRGVYGDITGDLK